MALVPRLDQRLAQGLVMTPQLQQAIKLLQLSNLELTEYVEGELQENPMLERDEGDRRDDGGESPPEADRSGSEENESAALESIDFTAAQPAEISTESGLDVDYDNEGNAATGRGQHFPRWRRYHPASHVSSRPCRDRILTSGIVYFSRA